VEIDRVARDLPRVRLYKLVALPLRVALHPLQLCLSLALNFLHRNKSCWDSKETVEGKYQEVLASLLTECSIVVPE
jgi:hypothetical protein